MSNATDSVAQGCHKAAVKRSVSADREANSHILSRLRDLLLPFTVLHHPAGQQGQKIPDASGRQSFVMSASNANDPLRADLDKLQKMLEENRSKCAEAKMRLEARAVAEKDGEAGWDQFYAEIRGKIHSLMDDSREIRTSHISMEVLLEASRQIHHESLAAIGAFAEERRAQRDAEHEELWRLIGELNQSR